jgi:hypothetical protein
VPWSIFALPASFVESMQTALACAPATATLRPHLHRPSRRIA